MAGLVFAIRATAVRILFTRKNTPRKERSRMPPIQYVSSFVEIEAEFTARTRQMVWCNVATVDSRGRPRSRLLHPVWEGTTGWIITRRHSPKAKDIAANPYVSLAYVSDVAKPVYAGCLAEWVDDVNEKLRVWELIRAAPPPVGFDPGAIFPSHEDPEAGLLRLTPWRIDVTDFPSGSRVWLSSTIA
jgi:general stress protein 26